jgi:hypothetical protein
MKLVDYLVCKEKLKKLYKQANGKGKKIILKEYLKYEQRKYI